MLATKIKLSTTRVRKSDTLKVIIALLLIKVGAGVEVSAEPSTQTSVTINDIVEFRNFSDITVCPESNLIATRVDRPSVAQNRIDHDWKIIEWPSGNIRFTKDAGVSIIKLGLSERSRPQWAPDCGWLYYRALHDGEVQVWRLNAKSGAQEQITVDEADIVNFALARNGQALVYETSASRGTILAAEAREYQRGILINDTIWPWARLTRTFPVFGRWATVRRWNAYSAGHLLSREPPKYKTIRIGDRKAGTASKSEVVKLTGASPDWVPQPNFGYMTSSTGNIAVVILTKKETIFDTIHGRHLLGSLSIVQREKLSEIHECDDDRCTAEHLVLLKWSKEESSIYFIAERMRGAGGVYEWTPASGEVRTVLETDGLLGALTSGDRRYRSGPCPVMENVAFCTAADFENPPRLIAISLASGSARMVVDPNVDLRNRFNMKAERIAWKDNLDRDAVGVLVYPRDFSNGTRYPLIVTTYRCSGFLSGGVADGGPEYALAEAGFLVLCIDKNNDIPQRLSANHPNGIAEYIGSLAEYESAVDMLEKRGLADHHRVGVTGLSFSAQAVSYALTHLNIFHAAALRALFVSEPAHEPFIRPGSTLADAVNKRHGIVGSEQEKKDAYGEISLTMRAERVTAPILVQASDSEYLGSLPAFAALYKLGKPVEMFVFPDETHQLHQAMHRAVNFERTLDWFRFWLQNYEDPALEKEEQYMRWREMRDEQCARRSKRSDLWYCQMQAGEIMD